MSQMPEQHSVPAEHTSPVCTQYDEPSSHLPPEQRFEQQSPLTLQLLPAVLHDVLRAAHLPPVHVPLQHAASDEQVAPSEVHAAVAHFPPTQLRPQH